MKTTYLFTLLALVCGSVQALMLGDAEKGRAAHDAKCLGCHTAQFGGDGSDLYLRKDRRVQSVEGLIRRVELCNEQTAAGLDEDQLNDITKYLNDSFYRFE
jgi:mono/diheme cytochrome c family protein